MCVVGSKGKKGAKLGGSEGKGVQRVMTRGLGWVERMSRRRGGEAVRRDGVSRRP